MLTAANVMIHERGGLQIIDFGVAGMVESKVDKRGTIIGTPNWMPPEHHRGIATRTEIQYGFEVSLRSGFNRLKRLPIPFHRLMSGHILSHYTRLPQAVLHTPGHRLIG